MSRGNVTLVVAPQVAGWVNLAVLQLAEVVVGNRSAELGQEMQSLAEELRTRFQNPDGALPALQPARALYRRIGLDPTKNRPSSEALLRRVLKGMDLYQINTVVDACNLCCLRFLLPIGLYDVATIKGHEVVARLGLEGEGYEGIGKGWVNAQGKLVLVDAEGPFGNPSADSARTRITENTQEVLMMILAPGGYSPEHLAEHMSCAAHTMAQYCRARLSGSCIVC
ncbi:MAG: phenylalanine--tRNA ligase beta subunit-related protein [bacterium]|nr:phenylalanine--tRNA ligase beta subunit-related protein [bacterium]